MFRPKRERKRPFPRILRRGRQRQSEVASEVSSKLEQGVQSVLNFCSGVIQVLYRLMTSPLRLARHVDQRGRLSSAVPPYTFLMLGTFAATKALRALIGAVLLSIFVALRGCEPETQIDPDVASFWAYLRLPSVDEVLLTGLPTVLIILVILKAASRFIARRTPPGGQHFFSLCLYIVGFQYILLIAAATAGMPRGFIFATDNPDFDGVGVVLLLVGLGAAVVWPAALFAIQVWSNLPMSKSSVFRSRPIRLVVATVLGVTVSLNTLFAGILVAYPLARFDLETSAAPRPVMQIVLVEGTVAQQLPTTVTVMLTNLSKFTLNFLPSFAEWQRSADNQYVTGRLIDWKASDGRLVSVKPGESTWLILMFDSVRAPNPNRGIFDWEAPWTYAVFGDTTRADWPLLEVVFPKSIFPVPIKVTGRLTLKSVNGSGNPAKIVAFVKG